MSSPASSDITDFSSTTADMLADTNDAVGLSSALAGDKRRSMLDLTNRLHSTGVQMDIDLPQIAVIGNQSAGKSSLIESISGITLPRASGTCTRCPTECRLSYSPDTWKCIVSLRIMTDRRGQVLGQAQNERFGDVIYDKSEVEDRIRRAQRAILNPHRPSKDFLMGADDDQEDGKGLTFSTNCVSLQISGPFVADLSFCDLPGLIRSTSGKDGSSNDIELIQRLVESYIKKPSCIILLTVSCETDIQNQGALELAKQFDPSGDRTVGVLTKPDRISTGDEGDWVGFIRNETHPLSNNWFCVKQPNSVELKAGITWSEARKKEDEYFSMTPPWVDLDPLYKKYLRTSNLVERLCDILSRLISKRLPEIHNELETSIQKTLSQLNELPKEPSEDPFSEISLLINGFTADLKRHLEGIPDKTGLLQAIRPSLEIFKKEIRKTAPNFKPYEERYALEKCIPNPTFLDHEEEDENAGGEEESSSTTSQVGRATQVVEPDAIYIDEVLKRAHEARTRELPGNHPYIVQESFISEITCQWRAPARTLCDEEYAITAKYVLDLVHKHFAEYGQGFLERQVRLIVQEHLRKRREITEERLDWLLALEARPFTLNTHYLADYKDKFLSYYKGFRAKDIHVDIKNRLMTVESRPPEDPKSLLPAPSSPISTAMSALINLGFRSISAIDLVKLLPPDEMEPALIIMAEVRAYFQVAYKRLTDNVPLAIDHELVRGLERGILQVIYSRMHITGQDGIRICRDLAQESPQVAGRREELKKKLERLRSASEELSRI